eukprot:GEZU01023999.1.p1 GENE.GEZU01023999.1~~GEZU01023999.1.p1  ORF type:complete len:124 (+),score=15.97 GEZU01023999.1:177-548(+)
MYVWHAFFLYILYIARFFLCLRSPYLLPLLLAASATATAATAITINIVFPIIVLLLLVVIVIVIVIVVVVVNSVEIFIVDENGRVQTNANAVGDLALIAVLAIFLAWAALLFKHWLWRPPKKG